ncbi:uncharacterized [Tachysurus ichikawai]
MTQLPPSMVASHTLMQAKLPAEADVAASQATLNAEANVEAPQNWLQAMLPAKANMAASQASFQSQDMLLSQTINPVPSPVVGHAHG